MRKWNFLIGGILAVLGILLIIFPQACVKVVVIALGLGSIADAVYNLIYTRKLFADIGLGLPVVVKSIAGILVGVLAVVLPLAFAGTMWTVMIYVLAVYLVLYSLTGFYYCARLRNTGIERRNIILENFTCLLAAVLLFIIPTEVLGVIVIRVIGAVSVILGAVLLVLEYRLARNTVTIKAEVTDDN